MKIVGMESLNSVNKNAAEQSASDSAVSGDFEKLRSILVKEEREEIRRLQEQVDALQFRITDEKTRSTDISEILNSATQMTLKRNEIYGANFKPIIVEQFQNSSRENPEIMAEALFPILGPAIRKMIASMLTPDANKAKRTYKFEQIFLIEKESGLPICHAKSGTGEARDADMVSGMLTAIQSFVQDAFSTQEFDSLNTLQLGELSVWIEWGPEAVAAALIRGVAPERCRIALQQLLEDIHSKYKQQLDAYDGDASAFDSVKEDFKLFMDSHDSRLRNRVKGIPENVRKKLAIVGFLVFCLFAWIIQNKYDESRWARFVKQLDSHPGIVVTGYERRDRQYVVRGLRDPLAIDVDTLLIDSGFKRDRVIFNLEPYKSMQPEFNFRIFKSGLLLPSGENWDLDGSALKITGAETNDWIENIKKFNDQYSEITHVTFGPATQ